MVTIRKFYDPNAALIAKAMLEGEGLLVFLKNENFAAVMPIHNPAIGEIELQVEKDEVERALEILGPESENPEEVVLITKRLNRMFLITISCGIFVGISHAAIHKFAHADLPTSIYIGILASVLTFLVLSIFKK